MHNLLIAYFIFLVFAALIILVLISKSQIKKPMRFIVFILFLIALPIVIEYFYLMYFSPLPETIVPDVIGLDERKAVARVERLGLTANVESRGEDSELVTGQRPEPGKVVKIGRVVFITLGKTENAVPPSVVITPLMTGETSSTPEIQIEIITGEAR